jgi:hypothetical protein
MGGMAALATESITNVFGFPGRPDSLVVRFIMALMVLFTPGMNVVGLPLDMRRRARLHTGPVVKSPGHEPYVLFVRPIPGEPQLSFGQPVLPAVARYGFMSWAEFSVEEELQKIFKPYGTLMCVGEPGNGLGLPGGTRLYVPPDNWRPIVSKAMEHARLVILTTEATEEILWALTEAVRLLPPSRLLLFAPRDRDTYERFRQCAAERLHPARRLSFPKYPYKDDDRDDGVALPDVIHFDADWRPKFLRLQPPDGAPVIGRRARREMVQTLLRPLLES